MHLEKRGFVIFLQGPTFGILLTPESNKLHTFRYPNLISAILEDFFGSGPSPVK